MIDSQTGISRPAGGPKETDPSTGLHGVDYHDSLIPWCKGNSVSVDHNTLHLYRRLMDGLVRNYRARLSMIDSGVRGQKLDQDAGITADELTRIYGEAQTTRRTRRSGVGEATQDWKLAESLFMSLLLNRHIQLYSTSNARSAQKEDEIIDKWTIAVQQGMDIGEWMKYGICGFLVTKKMQNAHIRLVGNYGWETYIRDYSGAPPGTRNVTAGSLQSNLEITSERTMPIALHYSLAETLARANGRGGPDNEWGKNQSIIRREIANAAIDGPTADRLPLDEYYKIFAKHGAAHMADSFFARSIGDNSSARYKLEQVPNSDPRKWNVILEPAFLRWRELSRKRQRARGSSGPGATTGGGSP